MALTAPHPPMITGLFPSASRFSMGWQVTSMILGSVLIGVAAQCVVILPWTPVPITAQTLAVLLVGTLLGSRAGVATVLLYLAEGASGLPVFAGWGFGVHHLVGPTGGYLFGFVPAVAIVGVLAERGWDRRPLLNAVSLTLGTAVIFGCGLVWLARFLDGAAVWQAGLIPFLPGAAVKIVLAMALVPAGWWLLRLRK